MTENQGTILIVDDEPGGLLVLEAFLKAPGYSVVTAQNGFEAIERAREHTPDIVLMDVMMPKMDGYEVCRRMRSDPLLAEVPILMLTALGDRQSRLKGIEAGADDFFTKPYDREELRMRVKTIMRLNRYRRLLTERARFVWTVDQSKEGYCILDEKDRIVYANPAARTFLNLPAEDKAPEQFYPWVQKHYSCEPSEVWKDWMEPGTKRDALFLIRPETERSKAVWMQVEVLNLPMGRKNGLLVRITEISERLALQKELWSFHSAVSHKLRTPLSNIMMIAELLRQQDKQSSMMADSLTQEAQRLFSEINDILGYLNAQSMTKTGSYFKLANLDMLIKGICNDLGISKVQVHAARALPPDTQLKLSYRGMDLVLQEIMENARKFHPQLDPEIDVRVDTTDTNTTVINIRDDGVHLSPEDLRQVWTPYYQAEKDFTGQIDGMGLGLATVSALVWDVGGKVRMFNREDCPGVVIELMIPEVV
jgi:two-component system, cell cycle response regulator